MEATVMTRLRTMVLALAILSTGSCGGTHMASASAPSRGEQMEISPAGSRAPTQGASANFTGSVTVTPLFSATPHTRAAGASVTFEPGARSAWHSHPAGQTLIVTAGTGWIQQWGGQKRELRPGDVVWTPPGVKHWHGGTATEGLTHIAIQEHVDGKVVYWMEPVSDEQYRN